MIRHYAEVTPREDCPTPKGITDHAWENFAPGWWICNQCGRLSNVVTDPRPTRRDWSDAVDAAQLREASERG